MQLPLAKKSSNRSQSRPRSLAALNCWHVRQATRLAKQYAGLSALPQTPGNNVTTLPLHLSAIVLPSLLALFKRFALSVRLSRQVASCGLDTSGVGAPARPTF